MTNEQDRVHQLMQDIAAGVDVGNQLIYDNRTRTLRPASGYHDPDRAIVVTNDDMKHFCRTEGKDR